MDGKQSVNSSHAFYGKFVSELADPPPSPGLHRPDRYNDNHGMQRILVSTARSLCN